MNRLIILCILIVSAVFAQAATMQYYSYPNAKRMRDTGRVLMYDNLSGSRNLTGAQIRSEVLGGNGALVKQAPAGAGDYVRIFEVKNAVGTIVQYTQANGCLTFGTPTPLAIGSVYPANGATNVSNGTWFNYSSTSGGWNYWARNNATTPAITFNKEPFGAGITKTYIVGSSIAPSTAGAVLSFANFSGVPGAIYTLRADRTYLQTTQQDGETTSSCGSAMTDVAGICTSTFQMK
ncbi:MAG: hypothetical protein H7Y05_14975 [Steroidobacteraceae bacterium]|nr:hypothetical protein [Deltaproteobacteria bacterium]